MKVGDVVRIKTKRLAHLHGAEGIVASPINNKGRFGVLLISQCVAEIWYLKEELEYPA